MNINKANAKKYSSQIYYMFGETSWSTSGSVPTWDTSHSKGLPRHELYSD